MMPRSERASDENLDEKIRLATRLVNLEKTKPTIAARVCMTKTSSVYYSSHKSESSKQGGANQNIMSAHLEDRTKLLAI